MALSITSSMAASTSIRRLGESVETAGEQVDKLSTGKRINRASDDVAASAIAARLSAEVAGLKQAGINAGQASSLVQIADGAYRNIEDNLVRAKQLAIQAGSDSLSDTERSFLDQEFQAHLAEIDRIANDTTFNGKSLIDQSRQTVSPLGTERLTGVATAMGGTGTFTVGMSVNGQGIEGVSFRNLALADGTNLTLTQGARVRNNGTTFSNVQSLTFAGVNIPGSSNANLNLNTVMVRTADSETTNAEFVVNVRDVPELTAMMTAGGTRVGVTMATSIPLPNVVTGQTGSALLQVTSDFELRIPNAPIPATTGTIALIGQQGRQFDIQVGTGAQPAEDEIALTLAGATTQALELVGTDIASKTAADRALGELDQAIDALQARRAELAAAANRLDHAENTIQLSRENQDAARAALEDSNLAETITSFSQQQLLVQSGTATLAQVRDLQDSLLTGLLANTRGRSG